MITGIALIVVGRVVAIGANHLAHSGSPAAASELLRPTTIKSITAAQLSTGTARLFALDRNERLWSCNVGYDLSCRWAPVSQPRPR